MKNPFTKTMDLIAKNDLKHMPMDKIYPERQPIYKILEKADPITPDRVNLMIRRISILGQI